MHVTQSGISRAIASLEDELGIYLFNRTRLGVEPTVDGKELIQDAEGIVLKVQEFEEKARKKLLCRKKPSGKFGHSYVWQRPFVEIKINKEFYY
ncbi:LysR family transcriptional regulator [Bacillus sp. FJAT-29953]|uniref:LysR family transcriptional regulator n=1 Tax=Neobacillus rhizophilus TaxID=2833579 RepID=A0A942U882_9BACI|nr:LysR family transcriptional regulator [Neobacillus rhizophilus]MBS4214211.1 LysR family transcriptional regulator [Neobacillus rhizophilus]MBU8915998.1 LysR family transcriptional regulator [Bacillus sp. FJAT-29953]